MAIKTVVPAFILGKKYAIVGAQPYDLFREVMAKLEGESKVVG